MYGYLARTTVIAHHGIKGMKWGIRRFENPDGTLTEAGKKRYYDSNGKVKKIYPVVTGKRIGVGALSFSTGNLFHKHGKVMTRKAADLYLQNSLDKGRISNVYKDKKTGEEMVTLTDKGAKRFNALARFPKSVQNKGGDSVMSDYYIQMEKGFSKDITDRAKKSLASLGVAAATLGIGYAYNKSLTKSSTKSSSGTNSNIDIGAMTDDEFDAWVNDEYFNVQRKDKK